MGTFIRFKKYASVKTGTLHVAWVRTIGLTLYSPLRDKVSAFLFIYFIYVLLLPATEEPRGDKKSRRNPRQMVPKSFPDPTSPPQCSIGPYPATETDARILRCKGRLEIGSLLVAKNDSLGKGGVGAWWERQGSAPQASLAGGLSARAPGGWQLVLGAAVKALCSRMITTR